MRIETAFTRTGEDRTPSVFRPVRSTRGRPPIAYRLRINGPKDVEVARRSGAAVALLDSALVTALGYPMAFPPVVVVAAGVASAIDSTLPIVPFVSEAAVRAPRIEDIALALLEVDPIAARAVLERNREAVDPTYLAKRVLQEDREVAACRVRFFDLAPLIPRIGTPLPAVSLARHLRKNPPSAGPYL